LVAFSAEVRHISARMRPAHALVLAALVLAPSVARADGDVHQRYEQGVAAFQRGDFPAAAAAFDEVYRSTGETKHLWNLAFAEYEGHVTMAALGHMRAYAGKPDANPKNLERAKAYVDELTKKITRVTLTAPQGSKIEVDGAAYGVAPLGAPIELDPAQPHAIIARRGADVAKQALAPQGGKALDVTLSFPVAVPSAAPEPVAVAPAAAPPPTPAPPPPAPVTAPAAAEPAPSPATHDAPSSSGSSATRTWVTVGLGVGALAAVGLGVYFGIQSSNNADDAAAVSSKLATSACSGSAPDPRCGTITSDLSSENSDHTASIALYVAGGALAAGAVAAFLLIPHGDAHTSTGTLVPIVGPGTAGAGYQLAF
jgi:hypothetical protein